MSARGFNLSSALVSAWTCLLTAAIAWKITRERIGITILSAVLVECAANGSNAYLFLTNPDSDPIVSADLFLGLENSDVYTWVLQFLHPTYIYSRRELMVPGFWSWLGTFHSTCGGIVLTLLTVYSMLEVIRRHASNWPWICLGAAPLAYARQVLLALRGLSPIASQSNTLPSCPGAMELPLALVSSGGDDGLSSLCPRCLSR